MQNWKVDLAKQTRKWKIQNAGLWCLSLGALFFFEWYNVAVLAVAFKFFNMIRKRKWNLLDINQNREMKKIRQLQKFRNRFENRNSPEYERSFENLLYTFTSKKQYPLKVDSVYLSESGEELNVTMFPHGRDSKHVYCLKMPETVFKREDYELDGVSYQRVNISDDHHQLSVVFDADLKPVKVSEGLRVFIKGEQVKRAEWIRRQTNQQNNRSNVIRKSSKQNKN